MSAELQIREPAIDLREHPLYKNRRRILAVPAATAKKAEQQQTKHLLLNLCVAALIFGIFLAGVWSYSPASAAAIFAPVGRWWDGLLQAGFGANSGSGLAEKSPWILARTTGIVAYLLLFVSVAMGLTLTMRQARRLVHPAVVAYMHKLLSLSVLVFTGLHVVGLMLDSYLQISLVDSLIPFSTSYRPLWTGLGTIGVYLLLAVIISASISGRLGYKTWRGIHFATFGIFYATLLHGLMAGTDSSEGWMKATYLLTGFVVSFLTGNRIFSRSFSRSRNKQYQM